MSDLPSPPNKPDADGHEAGARKGPRVILPDATAQTVVESIEIAVPVMQQRRPFVGFAASLGLGLVGAAVWAGITLVTDYELGLVAIVIGVLAGLGARKGGPGRGAQWTGAICAAIAYFVGQTALVIHFAVNNPEFFEPSNDVAQAPQTTAPPNETPEPSASDSMPSNTGVFTDEVPDPPTAPDNGHPLLAVAVFLIGSFVLAVIYTFSGFSMVFLGIAVYEGYRIPRAG